MMREQSEKSDKEMATIKKQPENFKQREILELKNIIIELKNSVVSKVYLTTQKKESGTGE